MNVEKQEGSLITPGEAGAYHPGVESAGARSHSLWHTNEHAAQSDGHGTTRRSSPERYRCECLDALGSGIM